VHIAKLLTEIHAANMLLFLQLARYPFTGNTIKILINILWVIVEFFDFGVFFTVIKLGFRLFNCQPLQDSIFVSVFRVNIE